MEYIVYCDESRHEGSGHHQYMTIGTLWMPRDDKYRLSQELKLLRKNLSLNSEIKWSKVSNTRLEDYKKIVDFFFAHEAIKFRVIVVDKTKVDLQRHNGDAELGFYRFYYEVLEKWVESDNSYLVLLDYKKNKGSDRYSELRKYLEYKTKIIDLTVIDSHTTPLAQLCDLLTGAVAATWCGPKEGSPKKELSDYIASALGKHSLKFISPSPSLCKFNVFKIALT